MRQLRHSRHSLMKTRDKILLIINIIFLVLFLIPLRYLDLYKENYSTLSLNTRGYLYLLFLGIFAGMILGYETYVISNWKRAFIIFISVLMGVIIPHHYPYDLQGNIHLFLANLGFILLIATVFINIWYSYDSRILTFFILSLLASLVFYLRYAMVNTISEIIIMSSCLMISYYLYLKRPAH